MPKKVLVIDDDEIMNSLVCDQLREAGYEVLSASDGDAGVARAKETLPDAVIVDLAMPRMNGYEVCEAIRADESLRGTRVVALTSKSYPADKRGARRVGMDAYLVKPCAAEQLVAAIEA